MFFTLGWFIPMTIGFIGGTADLSVVVAIIGLVSIIGHMWWILTEAEWLYQMSKRRR